MTDLDLMLLIAGAVVTAMVVVGMVLLTPGNEVGIEADETEHHGSPRTQAHPPGAQRAVPQGS